MKEEIKKKILDLTEQYYNEVHKNKTFVPGQTRIQYAGRVFDEKEMKNLVSSSLDFWLTAGPYAEKVETRFKEFFDSEGFFLVNSGSSANLTMISTLRSEQLPDHLKPGDEVITPSVTFPTTLTPIIHNQLVPVFVDCEIDTYNMDTELIENAVSDKTRLIFLPHTLGNPNKMDRIMEIAKKHNLIVLEDTCDGNGGKYDGKLVGTIGAMGSLSFYPAHQMTMGEGGGVIINDGKYLRTAISIRDWGRDCYCQPGRNNTCGNRFNGQHGKLPFGYDHKYVYSNLGYNLKLTDMQAAIGLAQLDKLPSFVKARQDNFNFYYDAFKELTDYLILPRWEEKAEPSWFGFPITVKDNVKFNNLIKHLEKDNIETRKIFAGNIIKQPGFMNIKHRMGSELKNTDVIMEKTFFIGVYPGLTNEMREFVVKSFMRFFKKD